jgi:ubiquinone/menaquinone biosynthesis C-methylase UbiE
LNIEDLQKNWNAFGEADPLWAVLTFEGKENKQWNVAEFFETGEREIREVLECLESVKVNVRTSRALDFGCAVGRLTQALASRFDEVYGVDIAPSMIEGAKKFNKYGERCHYVLNEVDNLKFAGDNFFDLIYSNITLQHMKPVYSKKYLTEFSRILKPGGVLVFQLPSERSRGGSLLKRAARSIVPEKLIDWIFHARVRWSGEIRGTPVMEMYCIQKEKVVDLLTSLGMTMIQIQDASEKSSVWLSYRYIAVKN